MTSLVASGVGAYFVEQSQKVFLVAFVMGMNPFHMGSYSDLSSHFITTHKFLLLFQPGLTELIEVLTEVFDLLFTQVLITYNEIVRVFFDHRFLHLENFGDFCFRHCLI